MGVRQPSSIFPTQHHNEHENNWGGGGDGVHGQYLSKSSSFWRVFGGHLTHSMVNLLLLSSSHSQDHHHHHHSTSLEEEIIVQDDDDDHEEEEEDEEVIDGVEEVEKEDDSNNEEDEKEEEEDGQNENVRGKELWGVLRRGYKVVVLQMLRQRESELTRNVMHQIIQYRKDFAQKEEDAKCKVCLDNVANTVILGCGHLSMCSLCVEEVSFCPICRATDIEWVKILK